MRRGARAVDRGLQREVRPAREPRQLGAAAAGEQHRVRQHDGRQPVGGVLDELDDLRMRERLAAGQVELGEALADGLVDERAGSARAVSSAGAPCGELATTQ